MEPTTTITFTDRELKILTEALACYRQVNACFSLIQLDVSENDVSGVNLKLLYTGYDTEQVVAPPPDLESCPTCHGGGN